MVERQKVTAIIPTFNEALNIEGAIKSVDFADEIMVIDSYSTDNTIEIAKKYNVKLIQRKFDDFSSQKNFAIDLAKYNWIYILDADERITKKLKVEILDTLKAPSHFVGFFVCRSFYFLDTKINYGGWQRDKVIRLFKKDRCKYNGKLVHELIEYQGEAGFLKNKIEHFSYRNFDHYLNKLNHYATLQAESLFRKNKSVNIFHITLKPIIRFIIHYFIRLGFLDGFPGFVLASQHAFGVRTRYIKLSMLNKNKKR